MIQIRELSLPLSYTEKELLHAAAKRLQVLPAGITAVQLLKRSVDARKREQIHFTITIAAAVRDEADVLARMAKDATVTAWAPYRYAPPPKRRFSHAPIVIGSGPAGLFATLILAQAGAAPILLERGQDVDTRTKTVETFWRTGKLDPDCNVQFGEGGAGTFSDGKLTTGTKDPRIRHVLETFVACGAPEEILWQGKPHIGTDKLAPTVAKLRSRILALGGTVLFGACFCGMETQGKQLTGIRYRQNGQLHTLETSHLVLAIGHSARDTFSMLCDSGVALAQKQFAVGVRIEHLQANLNAALYGKSAPHPALGAADYKLAVHLPNGRSLYTFCMCPGGQVVAAASEDAHLVTNGMSLHARDNRNANSALLVGVQPADFGSDHPLAGVAFQRQLEHAAFLAGGGNWRAPVCLVGDFLKQQPSVRFGSVQPTYRPGTTFADPSTYLPDFLTQTLRSGLPLLGKRIRGFAAPDAVLTGVESRSSSPVRILRDETLQSMSHRGLYPCGEGAGYAGGIMSAAVDGIRCAEAILQEVNA